MQHQPDHIGTTVAQLRVPDELLTELTEARRRFHDARQHMEHAVDADDFGHQHRVNQTADELRQAEEAVEEVMRKIKAVFRTPA